MLGIANRLFEKFQKRRPPRLQRGLGSPFFVLFVGTCGDVRGCAMIVMLTPRMFELRIPSFVRSPRPSYWPIGRREKYTDISDFSLLWAAIFWPLVIPQDLRFVSLAFVS